MDFSKRQARASAEVASAKLDALVVSHMPNVQYLSGFTGSSGVLVGQEHRWTLITDGRYTQQAKEEVQGAKVCISKSSALVAAGDWLRSAGVRSVGIEADHLTVSLRSILRRTVGSGCRIRDTHGIVERLRIIKDVEEIDRLRKAAELGSSLLNVALAELRPGVSEISVAAEMEQAAREGGSDGMSFETIVASGPRSALPHGRASRALIPRKGFVVIDFGVILANYCSDMTRTVYVGRPSAADRYLYEAVREAQEAAVGAVAPGVEVGDVDEAARKVLRRAKLAKYFTHSTGHGVGLEIHEQPRIARGATEVLREGMVITIEPGAYIAGRGGVRIEDMVLVTSSGSENLTKVARDLLVL